LLNPAERLGKTCNSAEWGNKKKRKRPVRTLVRKGTFRDGEGIDGGESLELKVLEQNESLALGKGAPCELWMGGSIVGLQHTAHEQVQGEQEGKFQDTKCVRAANSREKWRKQLSKGAGKRERLEKQGAQLIGGNFKIVKNSVFGGKHG